MNILDAVLNAQNGAAASAAGRAVGLSPDQTTTALSALIPQLAGALHNNASAPGGLDALLGALGSGQHAQYVDNPSALGQPGTVDDGNSILGHILGSKDASRAVAAQAASQTGIGADVLKKLLPIAATMVMGAMAKRQAGSALPSGMSGMTGGGGGLMSMLAPMLDRNRDGSALDDIVKGLGGILGNR